ncbi:hypothetical protein N8000_07320 [Rhodospirillales bacterium]|nr:hypothetical protein [Rhodospirillales bacterium]
MDEQTEQAEQAVDTSDSLLANADSIEPTTQTEEAPTEQASEYKLGDLDINSVPEKFIDKETGVVKIDEIIKSNGELEKALHSRAPDTYEIDEVLKENNLTWESEEQEDEIKELFKTHRISNDAAKEIIQVYGKRVTQMVEQFGSPYDLDTEMTSLRTTWGNNTDARLKELNEFVETSNLPPEVFSTSPLKTAAGMQLLYDMMKNTKGPNVMRNAEVPVSDLETQLHEVMNNPLYFVQSAEGDKVRKNATQLSQQIAQKK